MSEDDLHDAQLAAQPQSISYRPSEEWEGLAKAYRIVGAFLLASAGLSLLGNIAQSVVLGGMSPWTWLLQQAGTGLASVPLAIAGIGMMRLRSWGAIVAFVSASIVAVAMMVMIAIQASGWSSGSVTTRMITVSLARSSAGHLAIAFLAYAMWQLCRRRGVFSVNMA